MKWTLNWTNNPPTKVNQMTTQAIHDNGRQAGPGPILDGKINVPKFLDWSI